MNEQNLINKSWNVIDSYLTFFTDGNLREMKVLHAELQNMKNRDLLKSEVLLETITALSAYLKPEREKTARKLLKNSRDNLSKLVKE
jgi:hypothetical protein